MKIGICHATGSESNPFVYHEVDINSIIKGKGHGGHEGDIIPPFDHPGGSFPGLNWSATSEAIYSELCQVPVADDPQPDPDPEPESPTDPEPESEAPPVEEEPEPEPTPEPTPEPDPEPTPEPEIEEPPVDETPDPTFPEEPEGIPDLVCSEGFVPGWLNSEGLPTSCIRDSPGPWVKDEMPIGDVPELLPVPEVQVTVPVLTDPTPELAETGSADVFALSALGIVLVLAGATAWVASRARRRTK